MSLNKVTQRLARRTGNDIKTLKRNVRELKTPQKVGADILQVSQYSNTGGGAPTLVGPVTIPAGQMGYIGFAIDPNIPTRTLFDLLFSIFVDPVISGGIPDEAHKIPSGSLLSASGNGKVSVSGWFDYSGTDASTTFNRQCFILVYNLDSSPHSYYFEHVEYAPTL